MKSKLMTTREMFKYLNVDRTTIYRLIKAGMPSYKLSKSCIRFDRRLVDKWLEERETSIKVKEFTPVEMK